MIKYIKWTKGFTYSTCPDCGGQLRSTDMADECMNCSYFYWYG